MVKLLPTCEGLKAYRALTADGIEANVTLGYSKSLAPDRPRNGATSAALLTLLPLALAIGEGAEMRQPLAIAIVAGLLLEVPLVLVVLPALLQLILEERVDALGRKD